MYRRTICLSCCVGWAASLIGATALAQTDPLYMSDGDGHRLLVVQGGAIVKTFPAVPAIRAFPIAVVDTVRVTGYASGEIGGEYTLDGVPTGNQYTLREGNIMSDGTTDGVEFNYGISFTGQVWKYDRDWAGGVLLFDAGANGRERKAGIAYDPSDDTLWISADRAAGMYHYALDGTLLDQFDTVPNLDWNLALEPSTGTLWISQFGTNILHQYRKDGTYLGPVTVPDMNARSFFSGEFPFGGGATCRYTIKRSKPKRGCDTCPTRGDVFKTQTACEQVGDCVKKIKTIIACPEGNGRCKIKAKRAACD